MTEHHDVLTESPTAADTLPSDPAVPTRSSIPDGEVLAEIVGAIDRMTAAFERIATVLEKFERQADHVIDKTLHSVR